MNREILTRERLEADQHYNEALTALDQAIVDSGRHPELGRQDFERLANRLIVFLQQITAFVESKDRELAADMVERISKVGSAIDTVAELRTQVNVLQRATRSGAAPGTAFSTSALSTQHQAAQHSAPEHIYVAFEDEFRGSDRAIAEKVRTYLPIFRGATGVVVDLGCGRGELLAALQSAGIQAKGVDSNAEMAAIARERDVDATQGDALAFIEACPDDSLGGIVATQVIEHLEPDYLLRLLDTAAPKLRAGAPIVLETINPTCWLAFFSSYIRDITHVRPIHPDTLQYLLRANGFERVEIRYSAPVPDSMKLKTIDVPASMQASAEPIAATLTAMAHAINANAAILNSLLFTHLDYAAVGFRA